jgi:hypothetical protein
MILGTMLVRVQMSEDRVFVTGTDAHFIRVVPLECSDDKAAIESTRQFVGGRDIELWQLDRHGELRPQAGIRPLTLGFCS